MSRLADVLDSLDLALGHAAAVLGEDEIAAELALAAGARRGRGYLGGTLVLALAGGTGAGKSSLLNALAGAPVASVSALRPHTDEPLAWVDGDADLGLDALLDRLGVGARVAQRAFPGLCILDLPDQDSVVAAHRVTVERALDEVDAVAWVVEPEKYRDRALHADFLARLAPFYAEQFVFVLNKVDLLGQAADAVVADFRASLAESGLPGADVFPLAAAPPGGEPVGVDALAAYLAGRLDAKRTAAGKLLGDVRRAVVQVADAAGVRRGGGIDFAARWAEARRDAATVLSRGSYEDGLCRLEDFVAAVAVEVGAPLGSRIRSALPAAAIAPLGELAAAGAGRAALEDAAEEAVGGALRDCLWDRAALAASLASVDVAVAQAARRLAGDGPA